MKHYIILTPSISNMGGSEMFTANKVQYLQNNGWDVRVFFANPHGEIKIEALRQFSMNLIPEIGFAFYYINKRTRYKIINRICEGVSCDDETIIESHLLVQGYWGELIAKACNGRNILNAMEENIKPLSNNEAAFVEFKLKRMEILNASIKSFHRYFNDKYKEEYSSYTHDLMRAYCSNVTTNDDAFECGLSPANYNIMSIGRLDKPYILPMFGEIANFAKKNSRDKMNVIVIGGSPDGGVENKIKMLFSDIKNITLYFYGYLFPIPTKLLQQADVSIAMANSVLVTSDLGIPTIVLDIHDLQPIGIYGRTTTNQFSRDNEPIQRIPVLLNDVLIEHKYNKIAPKAIDINEELDKVYGKQIKFLDLSMSQDNIYYDVEKVFSCWHNFVYQIKYILIKLVNNKSISTPLKHS